MLYTIDEGTKRRLTERAELVVAVEFLQSRGVASDEIAVQLARFYYVDLDQVNEIVSQGAERASVPPFRHVA